jgi:hypothetical protein
MIMNLLPGLRELRAPLVSGYLWLLSAWLFLSHMNWLPSRRPPGNGEVARLWDLGGTLGKTVVLAAVTFIAYLIGSFLEMSPDGRIASFLTPVVLADRRPWYLKRALMTRTGIDIYDFQRALEANGIFFEDWKARAVAQSVSSEAKRDLMDVLEQRSMLPETMGPYQPRPAPPALMNDYESRSYRDRVQEWETRNRGRLDKLLRNEMAADVIILNIVEEMQQLASRLLVKNQELFGKYDRQMAEASLRMNVSIPLTVLLVLAAWLSGFTVRLQIGLTLIAFVFGFILLRQGFLRAVSARDIIVQALVIGEVESRYMPLEKATKSLTEEPARSKQPSEPDGKRA